MTDKNWTAVSITALAAIAGLLIFHVMAPVPDASEVRLEKRAQISSLEGEINAYNASVKRQEADLAKRIWTVSADEVGTATMQRVTNSARQFNLKLLAFRPQRPQAEGDLIREGFLTALEGSFINVMQFVRSIEDKPEKVLVSTVQVSSADGGSDLVTASVSLATFRKAEVKEKTL